MNVSHITYFLFGFCLILMTPGSAFAQNSGLAEIPSDSSEVNVRTVDSDTLKDVTSEQVFEYNEIAQNPDSLMSRVYRWLFQVIRNIMDNPWASVVIRFIFFVIFALVLLALINQILGGNLTTAFSKKKANDPLSLNIKNTTLKQTNYDELLNEALAESRYRDAVRLLYLKALQQLNEAELIAWKADKTNHDYLRELGTHPSKPAFSRLTSYYEYIEYGDFRIEKAGFQNVQDIYREFHKTANRS
ncbi:MAG TPA: DUF4129 domain-containing protein [Gracilimonas sp.]|uniref:DUF4129 domain-containing protein n=1 Tax=Gracilimonas sp. TaxID=1974203 RepID=UPI002DB0C806|nr:DUF4129 domain-containing protein [Gracilimonas sp.]